MIINQTQAVLIKISMIKAIIFLIKAKCIKFYYKKNQFCFNKL